MELELINNTRTFTQLQIYFDDFDEAETLGLELEDNEILYMKNTNNLFVTNNEGEREIASYNVSRELRQMLRVFLFSNLIHPDVLDNEPADHFTILSSWESIDYQVYLSGAKVGNFKTKEHIEQTMGKYQIRETKNPESNVHIFVCEKAK